MALDKKFKFSVDQDKNLSMSMPTKDSGSINVRVEECVFMPDENYMEFTSIEDFYKWKFKKEALATLQVNGKLTKENL